MRYGRGGHLFQSRYKGVLVEKNSCLVSQGSREVSGERYPNFRKPQDHDLKADLSDIDELNLTLSSEHLNLLRESRS